MKSILIALAIFGVTLLGYRQVIGMDETASQKPAASAGETKTAVFAGGCFWCTESDFEKVPGVIDAVSGYTGGKVENPTYSQVSAGGTGHIESVRVIYDPKVTNYEKLLDVFWRHIDPTDGGGQFVDRGGQYRSAIFYADQTQKKLAENSRKRLAASGQFSKPIATEILPLGPFYTAEAYHQDYYKKNPIRYRWYRSGSGRDKFIEKAWQEDKLAQYTHTKEAMGDKGAGATPDYLRPVPDDKALRATLTPLQYSVTRENDTERPFNNTYWDNHQAGIYVDVISGEPLFSSTDKFESGTGWPSFTRPLEPSNIVEKADISFFMSRTEVRSKHADSHLGHVFKDGPEPTGLRYCINSAALEFIPKTELEERGYGAYLTLFADHNRSAAVK